MKADRCGACFIRLYLHGLGGYSEGNFGADVQKR